MRVSPFLCFLVLVASSEKGEKVHFNELLKGCRRAREKGKVTWLQDLLPGLPRAAGSCDLTTHMTSFCGLEEIAKRLHFIHFVFLNNL